MYQLQSINNFNPFANITSGSIHFCPNASQAMLMQSVSKALAKGLSYTSNVYQFVTKDMENVLSEETLAVAKDKIENGRFGMDIYYCRQALELFNARYNAQSNLKALMSRGQLRIGKKVRAFQFGLKRFSSGLVIGLDHKEGVAILECKRRGSKYRYTLRMPCSNPHFLEAL